MLFQPPHTGIWELSTPTKTCKDGNQKIAKINWITSVLFGHQQQRLQFHTPLDLKIFFAICVALKQDAVFVTLVKFLIKLSIDYIQTCQATPQNVRKVVT